MEPLINLMDRLQRARANEGGMEMDRSRERETEKKNEVGLTADPFCYQS